MVQVARMVYHVRNLLALHGHVRLPESERVDIIGLEVRQAVVDEAMRGLVAAHRVHDVHELGVRLEPPVVLRDLRRGQVRPAGRRKGQHGNTEGRGIFG